MKVFGYLLLIVCAQLLLFSNCKQIYIPPAIKGNNQYLVVDGMIRNGMDSTVIILSRSANLGDSAGPQPELGAQVSIIGQSSGTFPLIDLGTGSYAAGQLSLDISQNYQLRITTQDGRQYASDFIPVRQSPPIDSLHWQADSTGVTVYVNTHDPQNNTRYYQWDYTETWEHRAHYNSTIELQLDGSTIPRPQDQQIFRCWTNANSTNISVITTTGLSQDLVNENPLISIDNQSVRISILYSVLVRQYAITQQAYEYWQNLKQNTELTGSIFDPQPSEVPGNIHCLTNPVEPVLGYVSASSESTARLFISINQLNSWFYQPFTGCSFWVPDSDSLAYYATLPTIIQPFLYCTINCVTALTYADCVDCRFFGGTNVSPGFWPN
jgi:hypothetical protein